MINYQRADLNITNFISNVNKNQKQLTHLSLAIKDGIEFCTSFNNMSQHSKDKLPTPGLKRKLKTHTTETKFQAIADVERGIESKAVIAKKYEIPPPPNTLSTWIKNAQKIMFD